jgi:hypothetical protein
MRRAQGAERALAPAVSTREIIAVYCAATACSGRGRLAHARQLQTGVAQDFQPTRKQFDPASE